MDTHVYLTNLAVRSQPAITAFSALPGAPVLPVVERTRPLAALARRIASIRLARRAPATVVAHPACS